MSDFTYRVLPFEDRVKVARAANIALYEDNPSPASAFLLETFERAVIQERKRRTKEKAGPTPATSSSPLRDESPAVDSDRIGPTHEGVAPSTSADAD